MTETRDLQALFDRIAAGTVTEADLVALRQTLLAGEGRDVVQVGKYNVHIGQGEDIQIGDRLYQGADAATIRQVFLEVLDQATAYRDRPPAPGEPPYKGLRYFDEADADLFFGREWLTARLAGHLRQHRLLVVVGASGSGKSSTVRAGLIPTLRRGKPLVDGTMPPEGSTTWHITVITPTDRPLQALEANLGTDTNLLVVDQFEELFTLCRDEAERREFVDRLLGLVEGDVPTHLVFVLRADFYTHCMAFTNLREVLPKYQINIGPMRQDELRCAIEEPARRGGWELEPGLSALLLRDVGDEPGALPLLAHALLETWKQRRGRIMTLQGYREAGGVHGAIARTADEVYEKFSPKQQAAARRIFLRLTELGEGTPDTRRRVALGELMLVSEERSETEAVLQTLAAARLVTTEQESIEVAHEAVIREWKQLRDWLDEDRESLRLHRQLAEDAKRWAALGEDSGALYRGARLVQAQEWMGKYADELEELEKEFLNASIAQDRREVEAREAQQQRDLETAQKLLAEAEARQQAEAERTAEAEARRQAEAERARVAEVRIQEQALAAKRLRRRALWLAGVLVLATGLGIAASVLGLRSESQRRVAVVRQWVAVGQLEFDRIAEGPFIGTALGIESLQVLPSLEADQLVRRGLDLLPRPVALMQHDDGVIAVAVSPEGRRIASGSKGGTARVWDAATGQEVVRMQHDSEVSAVAFSPNGRLVVSGSADGTVWVWDAATGQEEARMQHQGAVTAVAFSPDGRWVVSGSNDGTARVWDVAAEQEVTRTQHNGAVRAVAFGPDGRWAVSGSEDSTVRVWDAASGQEVARMQHGSYVWAVAFSPDGQRVVSGSWDGTARVWDVTTGQEIARTQHHPWVLAVTFSPDGRQVLSGSFDGTVRVWDAASGQVVAQMQHGSYVDETVFSPDGQWVVSGSGDDTARMWDAFTGQEVARMQHEDTVTAVTFSSDGRWVISGSFDGTVRVWDVATEREVAQMQHGSYVNAVVFSPDGRRMVSGSGDGTAQVWDVTTGQVVAQMQHGSSVDAVVFSPDGRWVVSGSDDGTARLWDASTGQEMARMQHNSGVSAVAFSPDGRWVVSGSDDGTARVWDAATGQEVARVHHGDDVTAAAFSPDGRRVVSGSLDGTARVWDAATGQEVVRVQHDSEVSAVAFSPNGRLVVSGSADGTTRAWDAATGQEMARLQQDAVVYAVAFSPDGRWVVSGSANGTAQVWEAAAGKEVAQLQHDGGVWAVAFSPDSRLVVSGGADDTARVWDAATGQEVARMQHDREVSVAAFSPDGHRVVSGSLDGMVRVWAWQAEDLIAEACRRLPRNLTREEWAQYIGSDIPYHATCPNLPVPEE